MKIAVEKAQSAGGASRSQMEVGFIDTKHGGGGGPGGGGGSGGGVGVTNSAWNEVNTERNRAREGVLRRYKIR